LRETYEEDVDRKMKRRGEDEAGGPGIRKKTASETGNYVIRQDFPYRGGRGGGGRGGRGGLWGGWRGRQAGGRGSGFYYCHFSLFIFFPKIIFVFPFFVVPFLFVIM
jgi:hypothetical protein